MSQPTTGEPTTRPHAAERAKPGRGVRATWNYTFGSLAFFVCVVSISIVAVAARRVGHGDVSMWVFAALVAFTVAVGCRFCWWMRAGIGTGLPGGGPLLLLLLPAALAWVVALGDTGYALTGAVPLWLAVTCLSVLAESDLRKAVLLAGAVLVAVHPVVVAAVHGIAVSDLGLSWRALLVPGLYMALLPLVFIGSIWWWDVVVQLDTSRRESSQLAVARERLRFASDLHDIQGHHLQVIALKTELAGRLMDTQPGAAREQIDEAQDLARTALEETRALVHGYRQVDFAAEVRNAADVLDAAGIRSRVEVDDSGLDTTAQKLLGLVIREATTNIIRHSDATGASFVLVDGEAGWVLEVTNDGADPTAGTPKGDGTGLAGLRRRLVEAGGTLDVDNAAGSFRLSAGVPARTEDMT